MAFLKLSDGRYITVTAEQGAHIWQVLNCEIEPKSDEEADKIGQVDRVILNRHNPITPVSYLKSFPDTIAHDGEYARMLGVRK